MLRVAQATWNSVSSERTDAALPQIDGYRFLQVIGHGGMSTVYLAEQTSLSRKVALKVMLPEALEDEVSRGRFENEARTIARLQHPHIVGIYEVARTRDGLPFYAMPHLPRGHLAHRNLRGDQPKVAAILRPLLEALDYAHVRGVVHRDVKAENVLFDENDRPLLADFGIALRRGSNPRLTSTGLAVGSTAYMPPEQARGGDVDRRADLYSLGVLTWEMLTGRLPYNAGDSLSMAMMHTQDPIPRLPSALKHWQGFIDKAMAKKPDQRFASARDMLDALGQLENRTGRAFAPVDVPDTASSAVLSPLPGKRGKALAIGLVALVALGVGVTRLVQPVIPLAAPAAAEKAPRPATAPAPANPLPAPAAGALTGVLTEIEPVAEAGAGNAYLANAQQQLQAGQLLAPANANAWDSWDAAWRINPTLPAVQMLTAQLFDALADASERALLAGSNTTARDTFRRAQQLDARRGGDGSAISLLRTRLHAVLATRVDGLAARQDRAGTQALLQDTLWLGLDATRSRALQARVPDAAATKATTPILIPTPTPARVVRATPVDVITVNRSDYARFVDATARASATCGRSGPFGGRRDWRTLGGGQGRPVVCVSAGDAQAYARWLSARGSGRYRLPSAGELKASPSTPISAWLTLCADNGCRRRMVSGQPRPFEADRGHATVGIRLVRER